ncbi:hypothetical protein EXIGLDRAFT_232427 [Exidia glandulosa HHB12029]|uniref:Uncharacterized protein n=1 Tax=Exidia glandulosa HHB12029 TaxID=1314781 RepID=A0A165E4L2_EXIGL|nr:hypothetical protein EXIGLDRAFT_232427 [Exidia glandulosa HHB12029]
MRPSILLVLVAAARIACARVNFRGDIEELEPTPCMVRAWVRAADMKPNAVSHGELKIKIVQPCTDQVEFVALRLGLDEMSELSNMANTTFDGDFWDFSGAIPLQDWTTTTHTRSAFQVENTLSTDGSLKSANWTEGVIFPFSVMSPNVNYPPAIFPVMFGVGLCGEVSVTNPVYKHLLITRL